MPSFQEQLADHVTNVFLNTDQFAVTYTQYPAGNSGSPVSVKGVFQEFKPVRNMEAGEAVDKTAELEIPESVAVAEKDVWVINGEEWQTESVGDPQYGSRIIQIFRFIIDHRTNSQGRYL